MDWLNALPMYHDAYSCKKCGVVVLHRDNALIFHKDYDVLWDFVVTKNMGILCTKCYNEYEFKFNIEDKNDEHLYLPYWKWKGEKKDEKQV
jgi:hypothetical protein